MTVYLDHAATTPMRPEVIEALTAALAVVGNPSSIHSAGQQAKRLLEESREQVAATLGADGIEVVFTGSGTEAVNLAIKGLWWQRQATGRWHATARPRILVPAGEHHATIDTVEWLAAHEGAVVDWSRRSTRSGALRLDALEAALARDAASVALVTMLWANNEVGTIQPVAEVARLTARAGVPLHVDAIAAYGQVPIDFRGLRRATDAAAGAGLVALSVSAHKIGGPVGIGALVLDRSAAVEPLIHGGGQQRACAPAPRTSRRRRRSRRRPAAVAERLDATPARMSRAARPAHRRRARRRARGAACSGDPDPAGPPARQRALHLPRLRGRLAAVPARRGRRRGVDRVGVPGGRARAVARAAGDGPLGGGRPRRPALHARATRSTDADVDAFLAALARRVRPGARRPASRRAPRRSTADAHEPRSSRGAHRGPRGIRSGSALPTLDG